MSAPSERKWTYIDDGDGGKHRVTIVELDGERGFVVRWVDSCSGCFESEDGYPVGNYPTHPKHRCYIGAGCSECGYKGIRRNEQWVPLAGMEVVR